MIDRVNCHLRVEGTVIGFPPQGAVFKQCTSKRAIPGQGRDKSYGIKAYSDPIRVQIFD